ncbi:MAG TPA: ATP-binding protein [Longimicrobiaceae bacterium]|nr:ATP-binding protein [Longimicrobiaceae bacterium]
MPDAQTAPCECGRGEKRGYRVGDKVLWTKCRECVAEARAAEEEAERREAERAARARQEARTEKAGEIMERLGVTRKYRNVTLGSFDATHDPHALQTAHEVTAAFLRGERPSLYLFSERPGEKIAPGCGKTHLAVGVLSTLALNPDIPLSDLAFVFVPRLLLEIQATFKHPERSELEVVEKYAKPELLVWDDFGAEKLSDYAARTLYTLLYEREGRSNVFTGNLSLADIEARDPSGYTQRITSRIAGEARILRMTGPDHRFPQAA